MTAHDRSTLTALGALPVAALLVEAGAVVAANTAAAALVDGPVGRELAELLPSRGDEAATWRTEVTSTAGVPCVVDVHDRRGEDPRVVVMVPVAEEVLLHESHQQLDIAFDRAPIGMAYFNPSGDYVMVNPALCALLGRAPEELLGRRDQEFTHPAHRAADVDASVQILSGEIDRWQTEKRFVRPDGSVVWAIANMTFLRDVDGHALHWLGQFQDITERKALEAELQRLADEDALTGLRNRRRFEQDLADALEGPSRGALLLLDLDGFKAINDAHGHAAGDSALIAVARGLELRAPAAATLARVGGDEFALLLPHTTGAEAHRIATDVGEAVRRIVLAASEPSIAMAISVGVATFGDVSQPTVAEVLAVADADMYAAKRRRP